MRRSAAIVVQGVIILIAMGMIGLMLWEPHLEGRNAHATPFEIYFKDPFLAFAYVASTPFFIALYQAFKVAGYGGRNAMASPETSRALRIIKYSAVAMIGFALVGEVFIMRGESDDRAGGVFMGGLVILGALVMGVSAAGFERILRKRAPLEAAR